MRKLLLLLLPGLGQQASSELRLRLRRQRQKQQQQQQAGPIDAVPLPVAHARHLLLLLLQQNKEHFLFRMTAQSGSSNKLENTREVGEGVGGQGAQPESGCPDNADASITNLTENFVLFGSEKRGKTCGKN